MNACRKPGEWQIYDIIYTAPRFSENGRLAVPARITVLHNGVLIQNNTEIRGTTDILDHPDYSTWHEGTHFPSGSWKSGELQEYLDQGAVESRHCEARFPRAEAIC